MRDELKCKTFRWYLETVYPESQMPLDYFFLGEIRNDATHNCLDTMGRKSGEEVGTAVIFGVHLYTVVLCFAVGRHELLPRARG